MDRKTTRHIRLSEKLAVSRIFRQQRDKLDGSFTFALGGGKGSDLLLRKKKKTNEKEKVYRPTSRSQEGLGKISWGNFSRFLALQAISGRANVGDELLLSGEEFSPVASSTGPAAPQARRPKQFSSPRCLCRRRRPDKEISRITDRFAIFVRQAAESALTRMK